MVEEFRDFLITHGALEEFCECALKMQGDTVSKMQWRFVVASMFSWGDANKHLGKSIDWSRISYEWVSLVKHSNKIPFKTREAFVSTLLKVNKKRILLNSIKDFKDS